ncbi:hypothetical protein FF1_033689 [Malus domestica]
MTIQSTLLIFSYRPLLLIQLMLLHWHCWCQ